MKYLGDVAVHDATDMVNGIAKIIRERLGYNNLPDSYVDMIKALYEEIKNYNGLITLFGNTPDMSSAKIIFHKFDEAEALYEGHLEYEHKQSKKTYH